MLRRSRGCHSAFFIPSPLWELDKTGWWIQTGGNKSQQSLGLTTSNKSSCPLWIGVRGRRIPETQKPFLLLSIQIMTVLLQRGVRDSPAVAEWGWRRRCTRKSARFHHLQRRLWYHKTLVSRETTKPFSSQTSPDWSAEFEHCGCECDCEKKPNQESLPHH